MKKSKFNPEVENTTQEKSRLREDIPTMKGELVDTAKGNPELEALQERMDEDGETHWVDFEGGDLEALEAEGFKDAGIGSYLISPIGERDWFSDRYMSCTGVVAIGRDAITGKEISLLSHQDPNYFIDGDEEKREMFSRALGDSLRELEARSEKDSVEVLLVGGNFNSGAASDGDYKHDQYKRSIQALGQIIQGLTGSDPRVLAGPNNRFGSETVVVVETQKRKIWIDRSEQPPEFDKPYLAKDIDEAERGWLSAEKNTQWEKVLGSIGALKDRLGKDVDENIKETVAAFLVNELPTRQSCEGHLEERSGKMKKIAPWIDVEITGPKERFIGDAEIKNDIAGRFNITPDEVFENDAALAAYWDYISENHIEETAEYQEARKKNEELKQKVLGLIDEFYRQRRSEDPRALRVIDIGPSGLFRVEGATGFVKEVPEEDIERRRMELAGEQAEMAALTEFLKKKFFGA